MKKNSTRSRPNSILVSSWRQPRTRIGISLALPVVVLALVGPFFAGPTTDFVGAPFASRAEVGPFGADLLGRDVWARYLAGGRSTLGVAVAATLLGVGIGCVVGMATALARGRLGEVVGRLLDMALVFPVYVLVLVFVSVFGPKSVVFVIAIGFIPIVGRVIRSSALEITNREHVHYARLLGASRWELMRREILPNITGPLSVEAGLRLTFAIALVSSLSYLGFGAQPPAADWGMMISENQIGLQTQPWSVFLPVITIAVLTIGTNLIADGFAAASAARGDHVDSAHVPEIGASANDLSAPASAEPSLSATRSHAG